MLVHMLAQDISDGGRWWGAGMGYFCQEGLWLWTLVCHKSPGPPGLGRPNLPTANLTSLTGLNVPKEVDSGSCAIIHFRFLLLCPVRISGRDWIVSVDELYKRLLPVWGLTETFSLGMEYLTMELNHKIEVYDKGYLCELYQREDFFTDVLRTWDWDWV